MTTHLAKGGRPNNPPLQPMTFTQVQLAATGQDLGSAARSVLEPLMVSLICHWRPVTPQLPRATRDGSATRATSRLLDWLEGHPGTTWRQRWEASESAGVRGTAWYEAAGFGRPALRSEIRYALNAVLVLKAVRPSHVWIMESRRERLWTDFVEVHDTDLFAHVAAMTAQAPHPDQTTWRVRTNLVNLCLVTGRSLTELTGADFISARRELMDRQRVGHRMHTIWEYARRAGLLPGEPDYMLQVTSAPPLTPEQLVARYNIEDPDIRAVFVEYLTERCTETDYSTLNGIAIHLLGKFWCDIQAHHRGIATLRLTSEQATAWRTRVATLSNGKPRKDWAQLLARVRCFYSDISHWAHEDPARWARLIRAVSAMMSSSSSSAISATRPRTSSTPAAP